MVGLLTIVATTQTGVGTVPEVSAVETYPSASDVACPAEIVTPPGTVAGDILKRTITPAIPLLLLSTTRNFTTELFDNDAAPTVLVPMISGVADTNCILLAAGPATVSVALLEDPVTDAVIKSVVEAQ